MREGLIRLGIKCLFFLLCVCKNSGARWSPRNDGKKGSQESKEGIPGPHFACPACQGPGCPGSIQAHSIPVAHMQPPHVPCGCLVLVGTELGFSLHNVL